VDVSVRLTMFVCSTQDRRREKEALEEIDRARLVRV
jgi:hypothetical protein